ncbi:glycoside hydrolase family 28 protein [Butyrivibrio sp. VCD2006]|uniref:glycoside hydrolase family 28 protein n=1 Tax=Butyrivibrio sp. VCD2006 TaxID=1280664 RepID=UPI000412E6E5|nr:glycoside hydrolase family 28 protein [Butyrivibrio sp. VCD2006]
MEFKIIDVQPRNITIELQNADAFEMKEEVHIFVNGEKFGSSKQNVICVDGLLPDKEYEIKLIDADNFDSSDKVVTKPESVLFDVKDFGAAGDGIKNDTAAIQAAISSCPVNGTVYFRRGTYLTGPVFLKSNMRIWLDDGAVLVGDPDRTHYPILSGMTLSTDEKSEYNLGTWEGNPLSCFASLITGIEVENVSIFGRGMIDGNAGNSDWWVDPKKKRIAWRPNLVFLKGCKNITLQGITAVNSPAWAIHPYYSDGIKILGVKILNPDDSPNTDGIDPESCTDVNIIGVNISVGDDCIAIKSGKYYMAQNHYKPTSGVVVRNCRLNRGHGSVTVGSECSGGVSDVKVSRCIFDSTDRGLRIKTRRGRGTKSVVKNILFEHISMRGVRMPFTVNMFYFCDPDGHSEYCQSKEEMEVNEMTPSIRSIRARNIECKDVDVSLLAVYGLPESKVAEIIFENIKAEFKPVKDRTPEVPVMMDGLEKMSGKGIFVRNVRSLVIRDVSIKGSADTKADIEDTGIYDIVNLKFT